VGLTVRSKLLSCDTFPLWLQPFVFRVWIWAQQTEKVPKRFKSV
jgi:hypothetical protein